MKKYLSIVMALLLVFCGGIFTKANAQEIKVTDKDLSIINQYIDKNDDYLFR